LIWNNSPANAKASSKATAELDNSLLFKGNNFVDTVIASQAQYQNKCNDTTMEDIGDALKERDDETHVLPPIYAQPNDQQQSILNQTHVSLDAHELQNI